MSPCPLCGLPGIHAGAIFPWDNPNGEVQVIHFCYERHGADAMHQWTEPAKDPLYVLGKVVDTQLRAMNPPYSKGVPE